jgi:transcriptional regulator with XRE-family HTH domain
MAKRHWTSTSTKDFLYRISFDFVGQIEEMMEKEGVTPSELARRLGVSKGRVSQILNNPGNLTLKTVVEYALEFGVKVAIVAYDDGDANNENGPVNPQIFATCWERSGRPTDFFSAGMATASTSTADVGAHWARSTVAGVVTVDREFREQIAEIPPDVWRQNQARSESDASTAGVLRCPS